MIALATALTLALAQDTVITLTLDRNAVAEGQQASFTVNTTDSWQPGRWRILGFFSGSPSALKYDAEPQDAIRTPVITAQHIGQTFALCLGVFEYGNASWRAETDAVEASINSLLNQRQQKANLLSQYISQINQADDAALDALQDAHDQARAIIDAGGVGAEDAAEAALAAGWDNADAAWAAVQPALAQYQSLLDQIEGIEESLRETIDAGRTYYANMVQDDSKAIKVEFLKKETATCKTAHKVRRELALVRPLGASDRVSFDSLPAGLVSVVKKGAAPRAGNEADVVTLELQGLAQVSGAVRDVQIRAVVNNEMIASMSHTNVEYQNLRFSRQHDLDSKLDFAYDDGKLVVPENHLVVYLRGRIFPAVSRIIAEEYLVDHLRVDIPVVDDSHGAATHVKLAPKRGLKKTDKKFATIDFGAKKTTPATTADKIQLGTYDGDGTGDFLTLYAYNGLPGKAKDNFGKKTAKILAVSIDNETAELASSDLRYFFTFRTTNHPNLGPANANDSVNGLWYYSSEGAGGADAQAVPGWSWANLTVGTSTYSILRAYAKDGSPGTQGETSGSPRTITLFGGSMATLSAGDGMKYSYDKETWGFALNDQNNPVKVRLHLVLAVNGKKFCDLVAHVWRHERRHAEQIERLAKANDQDNTDQDGDLVYNRQEMANQTDIAVDKTWRDFPISPTTAKHDEEVDCEHRANGVNGVREQDWAIETAVTGKGKNKTTIRSGLQWQE